MAPTPGVLQGHMMRESEVDQLLEEVGVGVLSMARDGEPYGIPLSFGYGGEDRLYFLFAGHSEEGKKVAFAEASDGVSFLVLDIASEGEWRSAVVSGPFDRITIDEWDVARETMADNAYRPDLLTDVNVHENPRVWALDAAEKSGRAMGDG